MLRPNRRAAAAEAGAGTRISARSLALALVCAACASSSDSRGRASIDEIDRMVQEGRYEEALARADELAKARPGDEAAQAAHRSASVAVLLERARRHSFEGRDLEALELVEQASALDPGLPLIERWRKRLRDKLAERYFIEGRAARARGAFEEAEASYERALEFDPEHPLATSQLEELATHLGYRSERSDEYYSGGIRAFASGQLSEARAFYGYSVKYEDHDPSRALRRISEVEREIARAKKHSATEQAALGYWRSALRDLKAALALDPELEGGAEMLPVYEREAAAAVRLRDAQIASMRHRYDLAKEILRESRDDTEHQRDAFDELLTSIDDAEAANLYQTALDLEHDFRYEEAAAAYERLLASRTSYKDAISRLSTLQDAIRVAAELYAAAEAEESPERKRDLYRQVEIVWPEYKDVRDRLAESAGGTTP